MYWYLVEFRQNLDVWYMLTCIWDQLLKIRIYNQITIKQAELQLNSDLVHIINNL